jgi:hypothetical protein
MHTRRASGVRNQPASRTGAQGSSLQATCCLRVALGGVYLTRVSPVSATLLCAQSASKRSPGSPGTGEVVVTVSAGQGTTTTTTGSGRNANSPIRGVSGSASSAQSAEADVTPLGGGGGAAAAMDTAQGGSSRNASSAAVAAAAAALMGLVTHHASSPSPGMKQRPLIPSCMFALPLAAVPAAART